MARFQIPSPPSASNKTIRLPDDVIWKVERLAAAAGISFNAFVAAAVKAALEQVEEPGGA